MSSRNELREEGSPASERKVSFQAGTNNEELKWVVKTWLFYTRM